jgi:ribosomal protein L20
MFQIVAPEARLPRAVDCAYRTAAAVRTVGDRLIAGLKAAGTRSIILLADLAINDQNAFDHRRSGQAASKSPEAWR